MISPLSGDSFHLTSIDEFTTEAAYVFLTEFKKKYRNKMIVLVWDNAPCHKPQIHREIPGLIVIFLPPYSPELNPAERFFEELRKSTANQIFETIEDQEVAIETKLNALTDDIPAMKQLLGYEWILEQCGVVS